MSGEEIIERLEKVKKLIDEDNTNQAKLNINYIVDIEWPLEVICQSATD